MQNDNFYSVLYPYFHITILNKIIVLYLVNYVEYHNNLGNI